MQSAISALRLLGGDSICAVWEVAGAESWAALGALRKFAPRHPQLALGVCRSADSPRWRLALQEGGRRGFGLSQNEPAARGRCGGTWGKVKAPQEAGTGRGR